MAAIVGGKMLGRVAYDTKAGPMCSLLGVEEVKEVAGDIHVDVEILVKRIGRFNRRVELRTCEGSIEPDAGVPDFKAVWRIRVPKSVGEYTYHLEGCAEGVSPKRSVLLLRVAERYLCSDRVPVGEE